MYTSIKEIDAEIQRLISIKKKIQTEEKSKILNALISTKEVSLQDFLPAQNELRKLIKESKNV